MHKREECSPEATQIEVCYSPPLLTFQLGAQYNTNPHPQEGQRVDHCKPRSEKVVRRRKTENPKKNTGRERKEDRGISGTNSKADLKQKMKPKKEPRMEPKAEMKAEHRRPKAEKRKRRKATDDGEGKMPEKERTAKKENDTEIENQNAMTEDYYSNMERCSEIQCRDRPQRSRTATNYGTQPKTSLLIS